MGLLDRFKKPAASAAPVQTIELVGGFQLPIVGESFDNRQECLEVLAGGRTSSGADLRVVACLVPDPQNQYDSNCVRVEIDELVVGNLSRDAAAAYQPMLLKNPKAKYVCGAQIVGGWDRGGGDVGKFGVVLDLAPAKHCLPT